MIQQFRKTRVSNITTFGMLYDQTMKHVISMTEYLNAKRIDFVFDSYPQILVKESTHKRDTVARSQLISSQ